MIKKKTLFLIILLIFFPFISKADIYDEIPDPEDFKVNVYDETDSLTDSDIKEINSIYKRVKDETGADIAIIIKSDTSYDIDYYKNKAFEKLGLGEKGKDNGTLIVVDLGNRTIGIETGYETEGFITDIESKDIIDEMAYTINSDSLSSGITKGFYLVSNLYAKEYGFDIDSEYDDSNESNSDNEAFREIVKIIIFIIFIMLISRGGRRGGPFIYFGGPGSGSYGGFGGFGGSSGSSGGFSGGSFGGGRSGGGGSSGGF